MPKDFIESLTYMAIHPSRIWSTIVRQAGMGVTKGCVHQPAAQLGHVLVCLG